MNRIQNIRKDSGFDLTDRVSVTVHENAALQSSLIQFKTIFAANFMDSLDFVPVFERSTQIEVNKYPLQLTYLKAIDYGNEEESGQTGNLKSSPKPAAKPVAKNAPAKPAPKSRPKTGS